MKKLLLILLCLPVIGFGQDGKSDMIIFSNGDTIYGSVLEVGVNNIKYQHLDESVNYVSKKTEILKIVYSSGRTENFEGLLVKNFQEKKYNNKKIRIQRREERRNTVYSFGLIGGLNNSNIRGQDVEETESRTGFYLGMFLTRKYLGVKWLPELVFQQRGMTKSVEGFFDVYNVLEKLQANYITLGLSTSFDISDIEFIAGSYIGYAITGESIAWDFPKNGNIYTRNVPIKEDEFFSRTEFGTKLEVLYYVTNILQFGINYEMSFTPVYPTNEYGSNRFWEPRGNFYYSVLKFGFRYVLVEK